MTILCIGDSNTYGYDPRSLLGSRYPAAIRWTERLPGWRVINCGVNGMGVPKDASTCIGLIQAKKPELVSVMLGTNDLLEGRSAELTAERMEAFLRSLGTGERRLLLVAPPPMQAGEWVQSEELIRESRRLGELYRALACRKEIGFADAGSWGVELCFDGVHFSPDGHAAFARGMAGVLEQYGCGSVPGPGAE